MEIVILIIFISYILLVGVLTYKTRKLINENHKAHDKLVKSMKKTIADIDKILDYRDSLRNDWWK